MTRFLAKLFWPAIIGGGLLLALGVFMARHGAVSGVEFSPDLVSHRNYHYYAVFGVRVWPKQTRQWRTDLEQYLHRRNLVPPTDVGPRWHPVLESRQGKPDRFGRAQPMCVELKCLAGRSGEWVTWSKQHPELAAKLWPRVVQLARAERYDQIRNAVLAARLAEKDGRFEAHYREFVGD